ncbi:MAG: hypothetical protein ACLFQK_02700 [Fibrobacterota bacterium]
MKLKTHILILVLCVSAHSIKIVSIPGKTESAPPEGTYTVKYASSSEASGESAPFIPAASGEIDFGGPSHKFPLRAYRFAHNGKELIIRLEISNKQGSTGTGKNGTVSEIEFQSPGNDPSVLRTVFSGTSSYAELDRKICRSKLTETEEKTIFQIYADMSAVENLLPFRRNGIKIYIKDFHLSEGKLMITGSSLLLNFLLPDKFSGKEVVYGAFESPVFDRGSIPVFSFDILSPGKKSFDISAEFQAAGLKTDKTDTTVILNKGLNSFYTALPITDYKDGSYVFHLNNIERAIKGRDTLALKESLKKRFPKPDREPFYSAWNGTLAKILEVYGSGKDTSGMTSILSDLSKSVMPPCFFCSTGGGIISLSAPSYSEPLPVLMLPAENSKKSYQGIITAYYPKSDYSHYNLDKITSYLNSLPFSKENMLDIVCTKSLVEYSGNRPGLFRNIFADTSATSKHRFKNNFRNSSVHSLNALKMPCGSFDPEIPAGFCAYSSPQKKDSVFLYGNRLKGLHSRRASVTGLVKYGNRTEFKAVKKGPSSWLISKKENVSSVRLNTEGDFIKILTNTDEKKFPKPEGENSVEILFNDGKISVMPDSDPACHKSRFAEGGIGSFLKMAPSFVLPVSKSVERAASFIPPLRKTAKSHGFKAVFLHDSSLISTANIIIAGDTSENILTARLFKNNNNFSKIYSGLMTILKEKGGDRAFFLQPNCEVPGGMILTLLPGKDEKVKDFVLPDKDLPACDYFITKDGNITEKGWFGCDWNFQN